MELRVSYAVSGTELCMVLRQARRAAKEERKKEKVARVLSCYVMYCRVWYWHVPHRATRLLRVCSTELAYDATRCAVLSRRTVLPGAEDSREREEAEGEGEEEEGEGEGEGASACQRREAEEEEEED
eukprot:276296-Rhodomonas_salina.4